LKSAGGGCYVILASSFIKIDADGNILWKRDMGGTSIARTSDGGYIAIASSNGNYQLAKTDPDGNLLWSRDLYYSSHVEQTTDGGYIMTGLRVSGTKGETALTLIKTDKDGNVKE
jgi:outer membrane protein assembly factor BamB